MAPLGKPEKEVSEEWVVRDGDVMGMKLTFILSLLFEVGHLGCFMSALTASRKKINNLNCNWLGIISNESGNI